MDNLTYLWDFGDGTTSTEKYPTHSYSATGTYQVVLTAYSSDGQVARSDAYPIEIQAPATFRFNSTTSTMAYYDTYLAFAGSGLKANNGIFNQSYSYFGPTFTSDTTVLMNGQYTAAFLGTAVDSGTNAYEFEMAQAPAGSSNIFYFGYWVQGGGSSFSPSSNYGRGQPVYLKYRPIENASYLVSPIEGTVGPLPKLNPGDKIGIVTNTGDGGLSQWPISFFINGTFVGTVSTVAQFGLPLCGNSILF